MVSTRQMCTTLSSSANNSVANDDSVRLSVATRQTTSNSNNNLMSSNFNSTTNPSIAMPSTSSSSSSLAISRLANQSQQLQQQQLHLLDLPTEILATIFSYVGYKKVGQMRVISHKFNDVCMHVLNSTFSKLITQTFNRFQAIKASMPRRESARRNHHLATECDIIETCYMRLQLLQMTFGKRIERGHCCFFPGAILDEVYTVLNYIRNTPRLERPYRVTDELFDLSTMAMEYFRDKIEPKLPDIAYFNKNFFTLSTVKRPLVIQSDLSDNSSSSSSSPPQSNMVLRKGIRKIKQGMKMYNNQLSVLRNELRTWKRKASEQGKQIAEQQKILAEQQKQTLEYANRLDENDKKNEEMSRKFSTLLQELNKCKTELQYWRSKSPATPTCTSCGQKTVCTLPLEEYNALINQGLKPEDIILNIDDADESDVTTLNKNNCEFVFPDESTTEKLLAVSVLSRKRPHDGGGAGNENNFNNNDESNKDVQSQSTSSESNSKVDLSQIKNDNDVTDTICSNTAVVTITNTIHTSSDLNLCVNLENNDAGEKLANKNVASVDHDKTNNNNNNNCNSLVTITNCFNEISGSGGDCGETSNSNCYTEDVTSLNSLSNIETKKARRVQKANRFSNGNGKRK